MDKGIKQQTSPIPLKIRDCASLPTVISKYILITLVILLFSNCSNEKRHIIGVYKDYPSEENILTTKISLKKNHTFRMVERFFEAEKKTTFNGVWEIKKDTLVLKFKGDYSRVQHYLMDVKNNCTKLLTLNYDVRFQKRGGLFFKCD